MAVAAGTALRERIEALEHAVLEASRIHRGALRGEAGNDR